MPSNRKIKKKLIKLPHISRFFSAKLFPFLGKLGLWVVLAALFTTNIKYFLDTAGSYQSQLVRTLLSTDSPIIHKKLAEFFGQKNNIKTSQNELTLSGSQKLFESAEVLGSETQDGENNKNGNRITPDQSLKYWGNLAQQKPDYRDAWAMAAVYAYNLGDLKSAQNSISHALELDPDNSDLIKIHQTIFR
jgi:tetratricopeptide (TPR) repeat protein